MNRGTLFFICITIILNISCKSEYSKYVESELKKEIKHDSLIFGMRIGQTQKEFFSMCWDLNQKKVLDQGTGAKSVKYIEPIIDTLNPSIKRKEMFFYGIFDENKIMQGMEMTYSYVAWAPWIKELQSDSLLTELKTKFLKDYPGNDYLEIDIEDIKTKAYAKIDGNRQILIYVKSVKDVVVKIEDLRYKFKK
jgi:hypothetical protein